MPLTCEQIVEEARKCNELADFVQALRGHSNSACLGIEFGEELTKYIFKDTLAEVRNDLIDVLVAAHNRLAEKIGAQKLV